MHPRVSIDQLCFPGSTIEEFVDRCIDLEAHSVVLTSPQLLVHGGVALAKRALFEGGLRVEAINHAFAVFPDLESDQGDAAAALEHLLGAAGELGARSVYLVTGGRGALSWEDAAIRFGELVAAGAAKARQRGIALMIENSSALYADIHIAHTFSDTVSLAERFDLGVCVDIQFCWAEAGLDGLFNRVMPRCGLVQVSDYVLGDRAVPGRAVPGDGAVPLPRLLGGVLEKGYEGIFDVEVLGPRIDAQGHLPAVARSVEKLEAILGALGA